jgi:type I restriction enzyme S subunit
MTENNNIPKHWQVKKLGEISKIKGGKRLPKGHTYSEGTTNFPYLRVTDFENQTINIDKLKYLNESTQKAIKNYIISIDDVYISIAGTIGLTGTIPRSLNGANLTENAAKITELNNCYNRYIALFLSSINGQSQIKEFTKTTTQPKLSLFRIEQINIPIPPLPEQQLIVSKIEALLSELENGKQQLQTAQKQLKVYRQSLLKWAFEGKLTSSMKNYELRITENQFGITNEELRITNQENHNNQGSDKGGLPKGWKRVKLSDLGTWKGGGTPSKQVSKYWENGSNLWVTSKDMKIGIINDSINKITDEAILNSSANRIPKGAILFVMRSGILRHTFPVAIAGKDLTVNQDLQTLSPNGLATSEFIYWFIRAFNNEIRQKCSKDGTTVESIESNSLKNYPFILPPFPEQHLIVSELESRLSVCDNLEFVIRNSLEQAETLRQCILKKAFEGKLINYESSITNYEETIAQSPRNS